MYNPRTAKNLTISMHYYTHIHTTHVQDLYVQKGRMKMTIVLNSKSQGYQEKNPNFMAQARQENSTAINQGLNYIQGLQFFLCALQSQQVWILANAELMLQLQYYMLFFQNGTFILSQINLLAEQVILHTYIIILKPHSLNPSINIELSLTSYMNLHVRDESTKVITVKHMLGQ